MTIYTYDTEFVENGETIKLVSIAIVDERGRDYYAVNVDLPEADLKNDPWLCRNVWGNLPLHDGHGETVTRDDEGLATAVLDRRSPLVKPKWVIANEVREFLLRDTVIDSNGVTNPPQLWAYYGAYDHVVLAQLWGRMMDLPKGIPMWSHDLNQLIDDPDRKWAVPHEPTQAHHALADARWNLQVLKAADYVA